MRPPASQASTTGGRRWARRLVALLALAGLLQVGCAGPPRYSERHQLDRLAVVFLDEESLHREWEARAGSRAVRLVPSFSAASPAVRSVRGFYDFRTRTIYCVKWDFEVCGHELHHAVLGDFHPDRASGPR